MVNQIVRGKTAACIAEELFVSLNTINTHTRRIYTKLGIHKKDELVKLVEQAQE
ncbi:transcriptional regulator MalT [Chlamydia trachomatis]|nr:transcriptional regulator MalT [Chlamydia trachomatis]